eukprot:1793003-Karenia_brevis.AAC.1
MGEQWKSMKWPLTPQSDRWMGVTTPCQFRGGGHSISIQESPLLHALPFSREEYKQDDGMTSKVI